MQFTNLMEFADWIAARGAEALSGADSVRDGALRDDRVLSTPSFRPSRKACQWCPLAVPGSCAARDEWIISDLLGGETLDDLPDLAATLPEPFSMTPARVAKVVAHASTIRDWLSAVEKSAFADAMHGNPPPGFKLVLGPEGDRERADVTLAETVLTSALGDAAYTRKLLSYPQAEKMMKPGRKKPGHPEAWEKISTNVYRAPARPMLVPSTNEKPEYRPNEAIEAMFDDI